MTERLVFLEPVDVWSFRDGRPFDAGEVFEAASIFPPAPWTVLGSLRTALLRRWCPDPERYAGRARLHSLECPVCAEGPCEAIQVVGRPDGPAPFQLTAPLPAKKRADGRVLRFLPTPADLVTFKAEGGAREHGQPAGLRTCARLAPMELPRGVATSGAGLKPIGYVGPQRPKPYPTNWLAEPELAAYLDGRPELPDTRIERPDEWQGDVHEEEVVLMSGSGTSAPGRRPPSARFPDLRIGIGMDYQQNTVKTGRFYVREAICLADGIEAGTNGRAGAGGGRWAFGLTVTVDRTIGLHEETVRLGGDGRLARLTEMEAPPWPDGRTGERRFRLYLAAPTFLSGGHLPGFLDRETLRGVWPGSDFIVRLSGVALAPPAVVGGWNLARQEPRPVRRLVGAGSVFYFELIEGRENDVLRAAHGRAFCDDEAMAGAGFGLAFVGEW
jgi:CRISPR/Cas system CMR-associated protein Cmr3 (group 5 of RAMP superfamily)